MHSKPDKQPTEQGGTEHRENHPAPQLALDLHLQLEHLLRTQPLALTDNHLALLDLKKDRLYRLNSLLSTQFSLIAVEGDVWWEEFLGQMYHGGAHPAIFFVQYGARSQPHLPPGSFDTEITEDIHGPMFGPFLNASEDYSILHLAEQQ